MLLTCKDAALHQDARSQLFMLYTSAADEACLQAYILQLVRCMDLAPQPLALYGHIRSPARQWQLQRSARKQLSVKGGQ